MSGLCARGRHAWQYASERWAGDLRYECVSCGRVTEDIEPKRALTLEERLANVEGALDLAARAMHVRDLERRVRKIERDRDIERIQSEGD